MPGGRHVSHEIVGWVLQHSIKCLSLDTSIYWLDPVAPMGCWVSSRWECRLLELSVATLLLLPWCLPGGPPRPRPIGGPISSFGFTRIWSIVTAEVGQLVSDDALKCSPFNRKEGVVQFGAFQGTGSVSDVRTFSNEKTCQFLKCTLTWVIILMHYIMLI